VHKLLEWEIKPIMIFDGSINIAKIIITEDSDLIVFGCEKV